MTFTIVAVDAPSQQFRVGVASRWPGVGGVVPWFRPGVGAVCTQHEADRRIAHRVLDELDASGGDVEAAVSNGIRPFRPERRQVIAASVSGDLFVWSGDEVTAAVGVARVPGIACAGNTLANAEVADAVVAAYVAGDELSAGWRLIAALRAGERAGGDRRGREAAAIRVWPFDGSDDPLPFDLRADEDPDPLTVLERALARREQVTAESS